jgi:hypothetical protein
MAWSNEYGSGRGTVYPAVMGHLAYQGRLMSVLLIVACGIVVNPDDVSSISWVVFVCIFYCNATRNKLVYMAYIFMYWNSASRVAWDVYRLENTREEGRSQGKGRRKGCR